MLFFRCDGGMFRLLRGAMGPMAGMTRRWTFGLRSDGKPGFFGRGIGLERREFNRPIGSRSVEAGDPVVIRA
jgi:hypothetical protein